eukprot:Platyproteum_vivax@DN12270_c0_g1_i2.p1
MVHVGVHGECVKLNPRYARLVFNSQLNTFEARLIKDSDVDWKQAACGMSAAFPNSPTAHLSMQNSFPPRWGQCEICKVGQAPWVAGLDASVSSWTGGPTGSSQSNSAAADVPYSTKYYPTVRCCGLLQSDSFMQENPVDNLPLSGEGGSSDHGVGSYTSCNKWVHPMCAALSGPKGAWHIHLQVVAKQEVVLAVRCPKHTHYI